MNWKAVSITGITFALFIAGPLGALDSAGREILEKAVEALGGVDNWSKINSFEIRGTQTSFGISKPFLVLRQRPNLYRIDYYDSSFSATDAFDGEAAWVQHDMMFGLKGTWPVVAPSFYAVWIQADAEFDPPFVGFQAGGYQVEYLGEDDCDGLKCFGFEFKMRTGQAEKWYVDAESFLPILRLRRIPYVGQLADDQVFYSDYREVSGVMIPFHAEHEFGNVYRVREVETVQPNADIDSAAFTLPLPVGMEKLRPLVGRFDVKVESFAEGMPPLETVGVSEIAKDFHGALLMEDASFVVLPGFPLRLRRFFTYDRFRDVFRVAYFDNSTAHLDVLEGRFEGDRLVLSNVSTNTGWKFFEQLHASRQTFYDISENGFSLDVENSTDDGKTWVLERRLTYRLSVK